MANSLDIRTISRREFLKLSSATLITLLALNKTSYAYAESAKWDEPLLNLGRVTTNKVELYDKPSLDAKIIRTLWKDLVLPITKVEIGSGEPAHNKIWYQLNDEGFVHSGYVQPVEIKLNKPLTTKAEKNLLAEVTVPYTDAVWNPLFKKMVAYRLYYSTTHWILDTIQDSQGETWYQVLEDFYQFKYSC